MSIARDATASHTSYGTAHSHTHTVTAAGGDRILIAFLGFWFPDGTRACSGMAYGGESLTIDDNVGAINGRLYVAHLVNPPTGANTITAWTTGASIYGTLMTVSYTGVDTTDPIGTIAKSTFTATSVSNDVTAGDKWVVVDCAHKQDTDDPGTPGAGQTSIVGPRSGGTGSGRPACECSEEAGAPSVTMSWSGMIAAKRGNHIAVPLKPAISERARLIKYWASTLDPKGRIFDNLGRVVPASLVEYDNWLRNEGPYIMTPKKHPSLIEADSIGYLEAIKFREGGQAQFVTETETLLESLFRRLGARGA